MMARRDLSVEAAVDRWLASLATERTEETLSSYHYRLKLFVEWCEDEGIDAVGELDGWTLDEYETHRRQVTSNPNTLKNELTTLKNWLEYCERIEVVDEEIAEKIEPPTVAKTDQASSVQLDTGRAAALLSFYRDGPRFGTTHHALLEVLWHTGARLSAVRALDVDDIEALDDGRQYVVFTNRPETGTRLKKGDRGQRPVLIADAVHTALEVYIDEHRVQTSDDYGREPLWSTSQGRASRGTIRRWTYEATVPCLHSPCPHGHERPGCEFLRHGKHSGCPSSRSPHQIRTGAITWMRDRGISEENVAARVDASVQTIRDHYDVADPMAELHRRADSTQDLDIAMEGDTNE